MPSFNLMLEESTTGAAKAALVNLTKVLSQEFGPKGIRLNTVSPVPVNTDLWLGENGIAKTVARASGVDADTARSAIVAGMGGIPSGRFSAPEEVATLIVLLASTRTANRERDRCELCVRWWSEKRPDSRETTYWQAKRSALTDWQKVHTTKPFQKSNLERA